MERKYGVYITQELKDEMEMFYGAEYRENSEILGIPLATGYYRNNETENVIAVYGVVFTDDELLYHFTYNENGDREYIDISNYTRIGDITDSENIF